MATEPYRTAHSPEFTFDWQYQEAESAEADHEAGDAVAQFSISA